ncbi:MAG: GxxExxY protein [Candidatus Marinimicrobia bacterium]|nr:GxxExxY protein [Candidatus Neomarinimicrobiota bacterium]
MKNKIVYKEESYQIMGTCFEVYKEMGCGFLESVYQECLEVEFNNKGLPVKSQKLVSLKYKGQKLKYTFVPNFLCYEKIIVEIKAVSNLIDDRRSQVLNYLNASGINLGLLVNFGHHPKLEYERFV